MITRGDPTTPDGRAVDTPSEPGRRARRVGAGQVWWIVLRRSTAWAALIIVVAGGIVMLAVHPDSWAANWSGLSAYMRTEIIVLGPLAAAFGCWEAGRDHRRRIGELLAATPTPRWRLDLVRLLVVLATVTAGYLGVFAVGAAMVAPVASYAGGRWPAAVALSVCGMVALAAVGWAVGRLVTFRLIAPVMGIVTYIGMGYTVYFSGGWTQLIPASKPPSGTQLKTMAFAGGAAFFLLVATAVFLLAARRWWAAALPAVLAVLVAIPLVTDGPRSWWEADVGAQQLVCSDDGSVCVWQSHAGLLAAVAEQARPLLAKITVPGGPDYRLVELPTADVVQSPQDGGVINISLINRATLSGRSLNWPGGVASAIGGVMYPSCDDWDETMSNIGYAATVMISLPEPSIQPGAPELRESNGPPHYAPDVQRLIDEYEAAPAAVRRAWLNDEIQAAQACDRDALHQLFRGIEQ